MAPAIGGSLRRPSLARDYASSVSTIMVKELRSRMRGRRPFVVLTVYLALLALVAYGVYVAVGPVALVRAEDAGPQVGLQQANASALIGKSIFSMLSILQLVLVSVMAPAFTAGQISLEREKQTLDLLITTPMRPGAIVLGKLATALAFVVLMIVAAVPISALVFMYGGAQMEDLVRQQVVLFATAVGFGSVGILASAVTKRTQAATVVSYCVVIGAILGTAMLFGFWDQVARRDDPFGVDPNVGAPDAIRYLNPMVAMLDVVASVEPTSGLRFTQPLYELFGTDLAGATTAESIDGPLGGGPQPPLVDAESIGHWWPRVTVTLLVVAVLSTAVSMRLLDPIGRRGLARRREAVA